MVETEKMIEFEKTSTTTSTQSATVFSKVNSTKKTAGVVMRIKRRPSLKKNKKKGNLTKSPL
jgi:hypothetical protein